jgi:ATP/maltotriose-dependent transcriptional regulator MalT
VSAPTLQVPATSAAGARSRTIDEVLADARSRLRRLTPRQAEVARQGGAVASGLNARIVIAWDDFFTGDWDEADHLLDEALQVADQLGYGLLAWPAKLVKALIASARGDDHLTQEFNAVIDWARPRGLGAVEWYACQARGLAALGRGDFDDAFRHASRISPPGVLASHCPHALTVLLDVVEAAVRTDRHAEAAAHVAAMQEANLAALSSRLALVTGAAAAMTASDHDAPGLFDAALAVPGVDRWQFDLARVRLLYGERLRRARAMREARQQFEVACQVFDRLRARPWIERATTELRATGRVKPRAGDDVLDRLTPQEYEIVSLAASGLTNRQIAERLFLSHRTVGGHLHRAFPKLGVATRAALRDALSAIPPDRLPR